MTIKDIARITGVSISTVSKIMNGKDQNIHPDTRARVLQAVKEYNYSPYSSLKSRAVSRTFLIGLIVRNISTCGDLISGICAAAQKKGYTLLLLESRDDLQLEEKQLTTLCKNHVDGVLWEPVSKGSSALAAELDRNEIPYWYIEGFQNENSFLADYSSVAYSMTKTLIEKGHENIVCILEREHRHAAGFTEGFKKALYENQIPFYERLKIVYSEDPYIPDLLHRKVTAAVSVSWKQAVSLADKLEQAHVSIPSEFSLLSILPSGLESSYPGLSGICISQEQFGTEMTQVLINRLENPGQESGPLSFSPPAVLNHMNTVSEPPGYRSKRFVVVGSINMDTTFHVNTLPQAGKSTHINNSINTIGGKGANQAVGISRLGRPVSLIGELGNDSEAAFIYESLGRENVNTVEIHRDSRQPTGRAYIYLEPDGESAISLLSGANNSLTSQDIQDRSRLFLRADYCLLSTEIPMDSIMSAAHIAHENGLKTIVKPASVPRIPEELYPLIDLFVPNRKEAALLCPLPEASVQQQADYFLERGIRHAVIITLGHKGCFLRTASTARSFPAADFTPVDTTGGADAFISALGVYLSDGYPIEQAVGIAGYSAGLCISRQGVFPALPDRSTLETHIARCEPELLQILPKALQSSETHLQQT